MLLKKSMLLGSTLTILILPTIVSAALLVTHNNTQEFSTVKVTSSKNHYCSVSNLFNKFTPPGGTSQTSVVEAKTICQATGNGFCEADMYATRNCDANGAQPIAHLQISLQTLQVTQIGPVLNRNYALDISGSTVTINYKKN